VYKIGFNMEFNGKPTTEIQEITEGSTSTPANSKVITGITTNQLRKLEIDTNNVRRIIGLTFFVFVELLDFADL